MGAGDIVRLQKDDYDELIWLMNKVFGESGNREFNMERLLPKMCKADDEHMGKHLAIRKDGGLKAVIGVYPLPATILDCSINFSTVGNVATLKEETGKGYMSALMDAAMLELERLDADASRLCGKRSRYNRYGFEVCGSRYVFTLNDFNVLSYCKPSEKLTFKPIEKKDSDILSFFLKVYNMRRFKVNRDTTDDLYDILAAWQNVVYLAVDANGKYVGLISASGDKNELSEVICADKDAYKLIVLNWISEMSPAILIPEMPHNVDELRFLSGVATRFTIEPSNLFKIIKWEKVIDATLKLKADYTIIPDCEIVLGIDGYDNISISSYKNNVVCAKTNKNADVTLDKNSAARYIFGPLPSMATAVECPLFPLPLTWDLQDRV